MILRPLAAALGDIEASGDVERVPDGALGDAPPVLYGPGGMFWLSRKKLVGSYVLFAATSRSYVAAP